MSKKKGDDDDDVKKFDYKALQQRLEPRGSLNSKSLIKCG